MKVLILAAGYGTRLKAIAEDTPKPLLLINGKPLLNFILDRFKDLPELKSVVVVTNSKFYGHFERWAKALPFPVPIKVVDDGTAAPEDRLGSIGDIQFVLNKGLLDDDDTLIIGGDNLFDFNLNAYIIFARGLGGRISIGLVDIGSLEEAKKFGVVELSKDKRIISFEEKPEHPRSSLVAMCFYYFPQSTLQSVNNYLTLHKRVDRAGDYIRWLAENKEVYGFQFMGKWYDIGSVESYYEAQKAFK